MDTSEIGSNLVVLGKYGMDMADPTTGPCWNQSQVMTIEVHNNIQLSMGI